MTTLHGGDFFIYRNSAGAAVRVDLKGSISDTVELLTQDVGGSIVDLPGLKNGDFGSMVSWPSTTWRGGGSVIAVDDSGNTSWAEYAAGDPNATPPKPTQRGSRAEIYAIYVASASAGTVLTMSTLAAGDFKPDDWQTNNTGYWSSEPPVLVRPDPDSTVKAPAGSGGVVVGAKFGGIVNNQPRYTAAASDDPTTDVPPIGFFPGGALHPGVTVATGSLSLASGSIIGSNVQAVAVNGSGQVYSVDLNYFRANEIMDDTTDPLGVDVRSLAVSPTGQFHAVDNSRNARVLSARVSAPVPTRMMASNSEVNSYPDGIP